jgi:hypothetical protein
MIITKRRIIIFIAVPFLIFALILVTFDPSSNFGYRPAIDISNGHCSFEDTNLTMLLCSLTVHNEASVPAVAYSSQISAPSNVTLVDAPIRISGNSNATVMIYVRGDFVPGENITIFLCFQDRGCIGVRQSLP